MPAQLVALNDGPNILIDKPILLIGRHAECDIQIDSRKISRRHCCIAQVDDYLVIRDLDSTNGIRINGVRVLEGKLHPGDELTVGSTRYRVSWEEAANRPRARVQAPPPRPLDDDDMLEGCDEPVALPDPVARPLPPPKDRTERSPSQDDDSFGIPENLELMPNSGSLPPGLRGR
jgi:pSer/pThr/pTyr-binding forkhead associated (FHA) protein